MDGHKLLDSISLTRLLSYGSEGTTLELEPLNVLIGPNASGKSNFIDAIGLLAAVPKNLLTPFRDGGTAEDWLWKGGSAEFAHLAVRLSGGIGYELKFDVLDFRLHIVQEMILGPDDEIYLQRDGRRFIIQPFHDVGSVNGMAPAPRALETLRKDAIDPLQSLLSQIRDPINYPQLSYVGDELGRIAFFRGWPTGRGNPLRKAQEANLPDDFLLEDGSNLGLIVNDLQNRRETKRLLLEKLRLVYEGIEDVTTKIQGGTIRIFFHEEGLGTPIPAARLSDGTLHYLCLLTVLLHPDPPPLICIEEPELGLHPDIVPKIADLLVEASKRTQLIVTTHSETLVSALSEVPEAIVVCERDNRGTQLRRLDPENLKEWLDRSQLGELWAKGEIGGNRW